MKIKKIKSTQAFALIESLVSTLLFIIGFVGLLTMTSYMIEATNTNKYRAEAVEMSNEIVSQMLMDKNNLNAYLDGGGAVARTKWDQLIALRLPKGVGNVSASGSNVTITVKWKRPEETDFHQYEIVTYIAYNNS